jgi:tetratricopeptide (TPR) repeat protein
MALYDAFISYSHAKDKPVATALQSVMQRLGKPWYRRRELRIFRDDTSLSATPHLWPSIEQALGQSRFLILLASPEAAASRWVDKEAAYWLENKSSETFLIALTDGELGWDESANDFAASTNMALPPVLRGRFPSEPKWVDLRPYRAGANVRDPAFMALAADFAAAVRGVPKEDLLSEELRQQRRALITAWSAAGAMLVLAVGIGLVGLGWLQQRDRALRALAGGRIAQSFAFDMVIEGRPPTGFPISLISDVLGRARAMQQQLTLPEMLPDLKRLEAMALRELATTRLIRGETQAALEAAQSSRDIVDGLLQSDPTNAQWRRDLSVSYNRVGEAVARAGQPEKALDVFRRSLAIGQDRDSTKSDTARQRDLAVSHERIGDMLFSLRQPEEAEAEYQAAFDIRRKLADAEPGNRQLQGELAVSYDRLGQIASSSQEADEAFEKSFAIRKKLAAEEPGNPGWQRDLAASYERVGDALLRKGHRKDAVAAFQKSFDLRQRLAAGNPDIVQWQVIVAYSLFHLGRADDADDRSRQRYAAALTILTALHDAGKLSMGDEGLRQEIKRRLDDLDGDKR